MLLTVVPLTAFAADTEEEQLPYCEIKFKEGCSDELKVGETTEIYIDYCPGEYVHNVYCRRFYGTFCV